jgi:hypothetical protein
MHHSLFSLDVSCYCGLCATMPISMGQNKSIYSVEIYVMYRELVGKPFAFGLCYFYLRNREKWKKFLANEECASQQCHPGCPLCNKMALAVKLEMATIDKVVANETKALALALGGK